jgi:hypothetical protein
MTNSVRSEPLGDAQGAGLYRAVRTPSRLRRMVQRPPAPSPFGSRGRQLGGSNGPGASPDLWPAASTMTGVDSRWTVMTQGPRSAVDGDPLRGLARSRQRGLCRAPRKAGPPDLTSVLVERIVNP